MAGAKKKDGAAENASAEAAASTDAPPAVDIDGTVETLDATAPGPAEQIPGGTEPPLEPVAGADASSPTEPTKQVARKSAPRPAAHERLRVTPVHGTLHHNGVAYRPGDVVEMAPAHVEALGHRVRVLTKT